MARHTARALYLLALIGVAMSGPAYSNAGASASSYASSSASTYGGGTGTGGGGGGGGGYGLPNYGAGGYGAGGYGGQQGGYGGQQGGFGAGGGFPNYGAPGAGGFGPNQFQDFHRYLQDFLNNLQEMVRQSANAIPPDGSLGDRFGAGGFGGQPPSSGFPAPPPIPPFPSSSAGTGGSNGASASASGTIGPGGGYGSTKVSTGDGLGDRFGGGIKEDSGPFPAPSGGTQSVSSFSSSSSSDVNGKKTSSKQASVTYNDNGKVTTYTSSDP